MSRYTEGLHELLRSGRFEEINLVQWEQILISLIAEEIETDAQLKHETPPAWTAGVSKVHVAMALKASTRDCGEMAASSIEFRHRLPTKARMLLSEALTSMVRNAYVHFKQSGYENEQTGTIVERALLMSVSLRGAIRADVLEELALDRKFSHRGRAAGNLVGQPFCNSPSPAFWKELEKQLSWAPELLLAVMAQYLDGHNPTDALRALQHVPAKPKENVIVSYIQMSLEETRRYSNRREVLKKLFPELPPWVLEMMKEKTQFLVFKEVLDLLEDNS